MTVKHINAQTLKQWLDNKEAILVDVREPAEYRAEHIAGAELRPLSSVCCGGMPDTKGKKLVIHCKKGGRGGSACEKLMKEEPELEVYNLEGGIDSWKQTGYKIESSGSFVLPLDRQVQLIVGSMVFMGSLLGYFVSPSYFLLSGFFGAGLVFASLTGFCGMAKLLALMQWNK